MLVTHLHDWLRDKTYCVFDTETSHSDPAQARLFELGALRVSRGRMVGALSVVVWQPEEVIAAAGEALAVNGIDPDEIRGGIPCAYAIEMLRAICSGADFVVGHNVGYDVRVVSGEADRNSVSLPLPRVLCTQALAWGGSPKCYALSIKKLAPDLGVKQGQAHRAFGDVLTTDQILSALLRRHRLTSVEELAARCDVWRKEVRAWFASKG